MKQTAEHTAPKTSRTASGGNAAPNGRVFFQPKLTVNQPDDGYEREADAMADSVMRMALPHGDRLPFFAPKPVVVQRQCKHCAEEEQLEKQLEKPRVQRKCKRCEDEETQVQRKEMDAGAPGVDADFERYATNLDGRGQPLAAEDRDFFEPRFQRDFSSVRIHTGSDAAQSADAIQARAYTTGAHIVFNAGQYRPDADSGRHLLAHELTHVVQQGGTGSAGSVQRLPKGISESRRCDSFKFEFEGYINNPSGEVVYQHGGVPTKQGDTGNPLKGEDGKNVVIPHNDKVAIGQLGYRFWRAVCLNGPQRAEAEIFWIRDAYVRKAESASAKPAETASAAPGNTAASSQLWNEIEVIPECPPRGRLLRGDITQNEIDGELYGGQGITVAVAVDDSFDVQFDALVPAWKSRFKDCTPNLEDDVPAEQQVCRADTAYAGQDEMTPGKVTAPKGIRLHTTPAVDDCDYVGKIGIAAKVFPKGTDLMIIGKGNAAHEQWVKIQIGDGQHEGWIQETFVKRITANDKTMDAVTLLTYTTKPGDRLEPLVKTIYRGYPYTTGNDRRTIVHAFSVLNEGNPAIYFEGSTGSWKDMFDPEFTKSRDIYQTIKLYAGRDIRFPTVAYIDYLRAKGEVGVRKDWKNTAISVARSIEGFLEGIVVGFFKAIWDTLKGLWDLIKGLITGELLNQAYELYKQIDEKGWSVIWEMIKGFAIGIYDRIKTAWVDPNPYQKWKFFGEIVGMILLEVVIIYLTAGAGAARHIGKLNKLFEALPGLRKVMTKVGTKLDDIPTKGGIDVAKLGKVEKRIDDLGELTGETRKMLREPKHAPTLDALTENKRAAKALKKCASPCYKDFLTPEQIKEVENILNHAETRQIHVDYDKLRNYFHEATDSKDLERRIGLVRRQGEELMDAPIGAGSGKPTRTKRIPFDDDPDFHKGFAEDSHVPGARNESLDDLNAGNRSVQERNAQGAGLFNLDKHHVFPQEKRAWFETRGMKGKDDIDNFTVKLQKAEHQAQHGGGDWQLARKEWTEEYNRLAMKRLHDAEAAKRIKVKRKSALLNAEEIKHVIFKVMEERGIPKAFVKYKE